MREREKRAVQTLAQLRKRWGADFGEGLDPDDEITVLGMTKETWVRLKDGTKGESTNYALQGGE